MLKTLQCDKDIKICGKDLFESQSWEVNRKEKEKIEEKEAGEKVLIPFLVQGILHAPEILSLKFHCHRKFFLSSLYQYRPS